MPRNALDESVASVLSLGDIAKPLSKSSGAQGKSLEMLRDELALMLGMRTDLTSTLLDGWINDAYAELMTTAKLEESQYSRGFLTVADVGTYLLPAQVWSISQLHPNDSVLDREFSPPFRKVLDIDEWRRLVDSSFISGSRYISRAGYFIHWNDVLGLWPNPLSAVPFTLDFVASPMPLVLDDDVPVIKPYLHGSLLMLAASIASFSLREFEVSVTFKNSYVASLREKRSQAEDKKDFVIGGLSFPRSRKELDSRLPREDNDVFDR